MPLRDLALAMAALAALPATALAQAYQCRVPSGPVSLPQVEREGPVRESRVAGYTLALSWSPEFCRFRDDQLRHARQCGGRAGRFAFIVHGLWPESGPGRWPQWCPTRRQPSTAEVRASMCMTPDLSLLAWQWEKHGACMTPDPDTYLRVTRILWNSLRMPDFDRLSRRDGLTAGAIRETFAEANPYWDAEDVGLLVNERGWLRELRLCYGTDFMPTACDRQRFGPRDDAQVRIWRGL